MKFGKLTLDRRDRIGDRGPWPDRRPWADDGDVVIGDIDDLSGVYADVIGKGGIEAINMAIADFGGTVNGKKLRS